MVEEKLVRFKNLFKGCYVFVGRECPREALTFVIRSFGGRVSWSDESAPASFCSEADERITHQIVDRPLQTHRFLSRLAIIVTIAVGSSGESRTLGRFINNELFYFKGHCHSSINNYSQ